MRKDKKDLAREERLEIGILLGKGYSFRAIAKALGRGHNTVAYEVKENSVNGTYEPVKAHAKARVRKRYRRLEWSKINASPALERAVIEKLKEHCNPDEIAGYLKRTKQPYVSKTAIYEWLRTSRGERYCKHLYSKRKRVKKRKPRSRKVLIPNRVSIHRRFLGADNRTRYGHMEGDTMVSGRGGSEAVAVLQERKSRLVVAKKVHSMSSRVCREAFATLLAPLSLLSATFDNGIENREHEKLGIPTFFCDPYSSWQKGGVENANKMIRRYFPKGTDWGVVPQREIDRVVQLINKKPRKILGYRSSLEVAAAAGIIKNSSVLTVG